MKIRGTIGYLKDLRRKRNEQENYFCKCRGCCWIPYAKKQRADRKHIDDQIKEGLVAQPDRAMDF